ncbi:hypothetical protein QTP88_024466 [Uroleucon formosanum]
MYLINNSDSRCHISLSYIIICCWLNNAIFLITIIIELIFQRLSLMMSVMTYEKQSEGRIFDSRAHLSEGDLNREICSLLGRRAGMQS